MIADLSHYPTISNQSDYANAVLYIFLARTVNFLASQDRIPDAHCLIWKVLELEDMIGYADFAPTYMKEMILREKQLFYIFHTITDYERYAYFRLVSNRLDWFCSFFISHFQ